MIPSLNDVHASLLRLLGPAQSPIGNQAPEAPGLAVAGSAPAPGAQPDTRVTSSCQIVDPKAKGYHLDAVVQPDQMMAAAELLNQHGFAMDTVTGVDWMAAGEMEVVYDFFHPAVGLHVVLRTKVPRANSEVPTISGVFPGANWHERETHELLGIRFLGHPNLTPLLLPEDATYHPLRKDFAGAN